MSIAAGDLQGRSFRLGQGTKVTVDRTQPTVVLAMPPMHADYISPSGNNSPTVLNLSVAPDGFTSELYPDDKYGYYGDTDRHHQLILFRARIDWRLGRIWRI